MIDLAEEFDTNITKDIYLRQSFISNRGTYLDPLRMEIPLISNVWPC